jgi:hypothetical protein
MIEVFKTNVHEPDHAMMLLAHIHSSFADHEANFDLDDCDRILRVKCTNGAVQPAKLIHLLAGLGFHAEVLPD